MTYPMFQLDKYRNYLSSESYKQRTPMVAYLVSVAVIGFFGNSLVIVVYSLKYPSSSMRAFILSLSVCDLLISVVAMPLQLYTIRHAYNANTEMCQVMFALASILSKLSVIILMAVAADRYWKVCRLHRRQLSEKLAWRAVAAISVVSIVVFGSLGTMYEAVPVGTHFPGVLVRMCWTSTDHGKAALSRAFNYISVSVFVGGIVLMFVAYASIWAKVRSSSVQPFVNQGPSREEAGKKRVSMPKDVQDPKDSSALFKTALSQETLQSTSGFERTTSEFASTLDPHPTEEMEESNPRKVSSQVRSTTTTTTDGQPFETSQDIRPPCRPDRSDQVTKESFSKDVLKLKDTIPPRESLGRSQEISRSPPKASRTMRERLHAVGKTLSRDVSEGSPRLSPASRRVHVRSTLMMSMLTLFYVIAWMPNIVSRWTFEFPVNWCSKFTKCGSNLNAISLRSYYLNSMVNAFIYSFFSAKFRQNCRALFQDWRRKLCASRI